MAAAPREIRFQRAFTADGIPEEHGEKVDHLIAPKAPPCKAHPLTDLGQNALLPQVLNEQSGFAKPGRRREDRLRRGLDDDRSIGDTVHMGLLDERCCILPFQRGTFLSLRARGYISLRIPWARQPKRRQWRRYRSRPLVGRWSTTWAFGQRGWTAPMRHLNRQATQRQQMQGFDQG